MVRLPDENRLVGPEMWQVRPTPVSQSEWGSLSAMLEKGVDFSIAVESDPTAVDSPGTKRSWS